MQRPHRRAHLRLWIVLSIAVGLLFVLGVALRQERPVETQTIQQSGNSLEGRPIRGAAA